MQTFPGAYRLDIVLQPHISCCSCDLSIYVWLCGIQYNLQPNNKRWDLSSCLRLSLIHPMCIKFGPGARRSHKHLKAPSGTWQPISNLGLEDFRKKGERDFQTAELCHWTETEGKWCLKQQQGWEALQNKLRNVTLHLVFCLKKSRNKALEQYLGTHFIRISKSLV